MPLTKAAGWLTSSGAFFEKIEDAKDEEFRRGIEAWVADQRIGVDESTYDKLAEIIFRDRAQLLLVFKELNGGAPISAPRAEGEPNTIVEIDPKHLPWK